MEMSECYVSQHTGTMLVFQYTVFGCMNNIFVSLRFHDLPTVCKPERRTVENFVLARLGFTS